jgi:hypothetical protein
VYPLNSSRIGIRGTVSKANFGNAVATADVNGDGYADVVVGIFKDNPVNQSTGQVMKTAGSVNVYSGVDGTLLYRWLGEASGDNFGYSVANAGDVNGDGKDDVIIGATGYDPIVSGSTLKNAGAAYVYSGSGGVSGTRLYKFQGQAAGDAFGSSVAAGNIDGDGRKDLIVGAPLFDPLDLASQKMGSAGRVYAFAGINGATLYQLDGGVSGDLFGTAVASGDVNNDGRSDIIVGSPKSDIVSTTTIKDAGAVFAYSGTTGALLTRLNGAAASDEFGRSVATGTIDGVAGSDIVVGAPKHDVVSATTLKDAGSIYAYSGVSFAPIAALQKNGSASGDAFGTAVAVGNVNNAGGADVIVGVCKSDYSNAGKVYKDAGSVNVYAGATGANLVTGSPLTGTTKSQGFGCAVATGNVVNGDTFADVIVGALYDDPSLIKDAGSVEIYSGSGL